MTDKRTIILFFAIIVLLVILIIIRVVYIEYEMNSKGCESSKIPREWQNPLDGDTSPAFTSQCVPDTKGWTNIKTPLPPVFPSGIHMTDIKTATSISDCQKMCKDDCNIYVYDPTSADASCSVNITDSAIPSRYYVKKGDPPTSSADYVTMGIRTDALISATANDCYGENLKSVTCRPTIAPNLQKYVSYTPDLGQQISHSGDSKSVQLNTGNETACQMRCSEYDCGYYVYNTTDPTSKNCTLYHGDPPKQIHTNNTSNKDQVSLGYLDTGKFPNFF